MNYLPNWNSGIEELACFSQIKLIVSDIDGTLFKSGNRHEHNKLNRIVKNLWTKGVHMTFATGRAFNGVKDIIQTFPITKPTPLILYNGSLVITPSSETINFIKIIDNQSLHRLVFLAKKYNILLFPYFIVSNLGNFIKFEEHVYAWGTCKNKQNEPNGLPVIWNSIINDKMLPVAIILKKPENTDIYNEIVKEIIEINNITFTKSSNEYIEIRPHESHKGNALRIICKELNINKNEVLTIGDNDNDVEMLKFAGVSVAVNNSSVAALKASKYISREDDVLGVIKTLELIRQAYRYIQIIKAVKNE